MQQITDLVVNLYAKDEVTPVLDPVRWELVELQVPARLWDDYYTARHSKDTERLAKARIEIVAAVVGILDRSARAWFQGAPESDTEPGGH